LIFIREVGERLYGLDELDKLNKFERIGIGRVYRSVFDKDLASTAKETFLVG
jgi:hypothetical protein